MSFIVRNITNNDKADELADIVHESFHDDPFTDWMRSGEERQERGKQQLIALFEKYRRTDIVELAIDKDTNDIVGLAVWIRPRPKYLKKTWTEWTAQWMFWLRNKWIDWWWGPSPSHMVRFRETINKYFEEFYKEEKGYWNLHLLAIRPGFQGKGISRLLIDPILAIADRTSTVAYLESSKQVPNLAIYGRFGFRQLDKIVECPDDNGNIGRLYPMRRDPKTMVAR